MNQRLRSSVASVLLFTTAPAAAISTAGCSTWISNFKKDPIGQIQNVVQIVQTIVSVGTLVFGQVKQALPPDSQAKAQADWDEALLKVNASVGALQAAVKVAEDANQVSPNFEKLASDLMKAVDALHAVVNLYGISPTAPGRLGAGKTPKGYDVFVQEIALLKGGMPGMVGSTR